MSCPALLTSSPFDTRFPPPVTGGIACDTQFGEEQPEWGLTITAYAILESERRLVSTTNPIYLELVDFLASGSTPRDVAEFHPSQEAQERVAELIEREKESELSGEETAELNHFLELEHILRVAKVKARLILNQ